MKIEKQQLITFGIFILGTILLAGVILSIDFLYAGIQEYLLTNVNPEYIPDLNLAKRVIVGSSIAIALGTGSFVLLLWFTVRKRKIKQTLEEEEIIDQDGSLNFKTFQVEISNSLTALKDLFGFLIIVVIVSGLFSFLRFIWIIGRFQTYDQFFIHYFLSNISSMIVSITLYIMIAMVMTFVLQTSLQRYYKLKIISESYNTAIEKALGNLERLLDEEEEKTKVTEGTTKE